MRTNDRKKFLEQAKTHGNSTYFTGIPCRKGHVAYRRVRGGCCIACQQDKTTAVERNEYRSLDYRKEHILRRVKAQAKMKGILFDIAVSDVEWLETCPILGVKLEYFATGGRRQNSVSLDRIDSRKGYVKGNVATISVRANSIKSNLTLEQADQLVAYIRCHLEEGVNA